jgi:hypothetical protein
MGGKTQASEQREYQYKRNQRNHSAHLRIAI